MSSDAASPTTPGQRLLAWLPIGIGLLLFYIPTLIDLFSGVWNSDRNAHGPIVLVVALWFLYFRIRQLLIEQAIQYRPNVVLGGSLIALGLIGYALGRSQGLHVLEVGSFIPMLAGCLAMFFGARLLGRIWFAFFLMLFFIPLPASIVDAVTQPMKIGVSSATEHVLYWLGYPISRNGVILNVGPYQLLVADACAGLNSLFTLEALGLLYMNIVRRASVMRNLALGVLIIPISFMSNVIRVVTLALITYYLGDAAGQGFLHGFASLLLFCSALLLIMGMDWMICKLIESERVQSADRKWSGTVATMPKRTTPMTTQRYGPGWPKLIDRATFRPMGIQMKAATGISFFMLLTAAAAHQLTPTQYFSDHIPDFEKLVPKQFADWKEIASPHIQIDLAIRDEANTTDQPYDAVLMRAYANSSGEQVMLAMAYAREQRQDIKIHQPEVCYVAQGFSILEESPASFSVLAESKPIEGTRLLTRNRERTEVVSYWIRIGNIFTSGAWQTRRYILQQGLSGRIPDGILVRVSSIVRNDGKPEQMYQRQEAFLVDLVEAVTSPDLVTLLGRQTG